MGKIFKNQTSLRIELMTGLTSDQLDGATMSIRYRKPNGIEGELDADELAIVDGATEEGILYYDLTADSTLLSQAGTYQFWSYVVFSDDREAAGEPFDVIVYEI